MITPPLKNPLKHLHLSDVRGMVQLAAQGTAGVARVAEGVHRSVWDTMGIPGGSSPGRTRGITGLVYNSVHDIALAVGKGVESGLGWLQSVAPGQHGLESARREALLAVLNGVMGDRLMASDNPLAIPMTLRYQGQTLSWPARLSMPEATSKVVVLIHGLCLNDLQWHAQHPERPGDHGAALASTLGYSPVYLRYNSGLHTSQNGRELSIQLERLVTHWPVPIEELTVVAHSMGGLLIRSACHAARPSASSWLGQLKNVVFLGTPHHGAPLERVGHWLDLILDSTPYTAPFARLGQLRSAGITDLRYGHLLDEDWQGRDRFQRGRDRRQIVPLPEGVNCYAVAATTAEKRGVMANRLVGDGLVPLRSALGEHDDSRRDLGLAEASRWIAFRMGHMELLSRPEVSRQIVRWLTPTW